LSPLTYDELVAELFPRLSGGIRWGLERTQRLLASVGGPHRSYRVLHVGGTNGKGSVAAHIDSVLRQSGRRVGLYTSPHLCTFRERIRIDGRPVGEAALLAAAERLWPAVRSEAPSFFEATTAVALLALAEAGVEDAVIEVGLGGRLDSTNVVSPEVTVLTNVSLDHVQLLGPTIADVAREKAGIIKAGVPVLTGETTGLAHDTFAAAARDAGAPFHVLDGVQEVVTGLHGTSFVLRREPWGEQELRTPLAGVHQATNAALAVGALGLLAEPPDIDAVRAGLAATRWPGRLQFERVGGAIWVFDVAHNVAGVEALVAALHALPLPRPLTAVIGVLGDKDWRGMLAPICEAADATLLTVPPTAPAERLWDPDVVLREVTLPRARAYADFGAALEAAHARSREGGTVLVTGSFHTVGDAQASLGLCKDGSDGVVERSAIADSRLPGPGAAL
jgi:dihydrofolate synthase / folylpolyglutamate synthase